MTAFAAIIAIIALIGIVLISIGIKLNRYDYKDNDINMLLFIIPGLGMLTVSVLIVIYLTIFT